MKSLFQQYPDWTSIAGVLVWIVSGPGAGAISFWAWELAEKVWPVLAKLATLPERAITLALTVLLGIGAFWAQIGMGYRPMPADWIDGIEQAFSIVAVAIISALTIHGAKKAKEEAQ